MSTPIAISFGCHLTGLAEIIRLHTQVLTPEAGFAGYVYHVAGEVGPVCADQQVMADSLRLSLAPSLAGGGYALCVRSGRMTEDVTKAWLEGVERLSCKNAFPVDHQTFAFRPIEVLGIALGISKATPLEATVANWFRSVIRRLESEGGNDFWSRSINTIAAHILAVSWPSLDSPPLDKMPIEELALYRWGLTVFPGLFVTDGQQPDLRTVDAELLRRTVISEIAPQDAARAAILHQAIRRAVNWGIESQLERVWQIGREEKDAVHIVENLCQRFHLCAKQLRSRHDNRSTIEIKDEYDVQDIMHALLRLHFEDVRPEEVTPSYAGSSSRMDFLLKRERVVVEVKMTRKNLGQKEIANQLIEDKERYRTHPDCRTLICFIYDPEGFLDNPAALEDDVSEPEADLCVLVIVSPKGM